MDEMALLAGPCKCFGCIIIGRSSAIGVNICKGCVARIVYVFVQSMMILVRHKKFDQCQTQHEIVD
jgi:hypothetical protein